MDWLSTMHLQYDREGEQNQTADIVSRINRTETEMADQEEEDLNTVHY